MTHMDFSSLLKSEDKVLTPEEFQKALVELKNQHKKKAKECAKEGRIVAYAVHRGRAEAIDFVLNLLQHTNI